MAHETDIIWTITAALFAAAVGGHLAALIRLPPILGFLLAGVVIGPFTPGPIADTEVAGQLAELGVILLLFGVGIHFSLRSLLDVSRVAVPGGLIQTVLLTGLTTTIFLFWDWSLGSALLIGLAISIASTVIVVASLTARNELDTLHGRVAVGWLIVEDLITVFVLVLIPVLANPADSDSASSIALALGWSAVKVALLTAIMFFIGAKAVPRLLVFTARLGSRELFLLTVLATALGIAFASARIFDVSLALGAFLAGLVVSEADLSHQAAADALPFQDAFAVLFFVSVGMLFDPRFLIESPMMVFVAVVLIVLIKPVLTFGLLGMLRFPLIPGLVIAASRAQIGEFSFILAELGRQYNVLSDEAVNVILAGSIISILVQPLVFKGIEPISTWLRMRPALMSSMTRAGNPSIVMQTDGDGQQRFRNHAVILGYGRVGSVIGGALQRRGLPYVVVDINHRTIEELHEQGIDAVYGDAANPMVLELLNLPRARVLIVAISDPITARLAIERAREIAPDLPVVVRTHSEFQREVFENIPNGEAVMGERELAIEMTRYALRRFGVSSTELQVVLQGLRSRDNAET